MIGDVLRYDHLVQRGIVVLSPPRLNYLFSTGHWQVILDMDSLLAAFGGLTWCNIPAAVRRETLSI